MTPNVPLLSWTPDLDLTRPGAVADVSNMIPTVRGYASHPALAAAVYYGGTLPSRCFGAGLVHFESSDPLPFVGTGTDIYSVFGGLNTLTRSTPAYTTIAVPQYSWRFDSFNNIALAVSRDNQLQETNDPYGGTRFTNVSGAPAAVTMCVQSGFVMLANFASGSWPYKNGWWCSALEDHTDWTPDLATQCDQGRLSETPGAIVRLIAYQNDVIAFKERAIYRGTYVNQPEAGIIWSWTPLSTQIGLVSHDAVCEANGLLYFLADDGFYTFNGASIQKIRSAPWGWLGTDGGGFESTETAQASYDPVWRVVRWHYKRSSSELNAGLVYHPETDRWGKFDAAIDYVFSVLYDDVSAPLSTTSILQQYVPAMVRTSDRAICAWNAAPGASTITTGDIGDDDRDTVLTKVRLRAYRTPGSASATHYHRRTLDAALTTGQTVSAVDGKYDFSQSSRWHRVAFSGTGHFDVGGFSIQAPRSGDR